MSRDEGEGRLFDQIVKRKKHSRQLTFLIHPKPLRSTERKRE